MRRYDPPRLAAVRNAAARAAADGAVTMPRRIATERLDLVAPGPQHEAMALDYFTDPRIANFIGGVRDAAGAWRTLAMFCGQWSLNGFGMYALERDDVPVGFVGLLFPDDWPEIELAYSLRPEVRGNGYVQEAARAVLAAAWQAGIPSLVSYISPRNLASQHVARRAGASHEGSIMLAGDLALVFRYPRPDPVAVAA